MTSREIDDLFAKTLSGDYDDDAPWSAVHALRIVGTREVFDKAAAWCESERPLLRARGADVLAQLGNSGVEHPRNAFPEESYSAVVAMIQKEPDSQPLAAGIHALGHLNNSAGVSLIAAFRSHPSPEVRSSVAFALWCFANEPLSVAALLTLTEDTESDVRDWATFGLAQCDADSLEIRDALVRRLTDSDEDTREEAMSGLAKRKDHRVLPVLLSALEQPHVSYRVIEAADLILDMESEGKRWIKAQYASAVRQRYSV
jgi:HEAT repeat protein